MPSWHASSLAHFLYQWETGAVSILSISRWSAYALHHRMSFGESVARLYAARRLLALCVSESRSNGWGPDACASPPRLLRARADVGCIDRSATCATRRRQSGIAVELLPRVYEGSLR